MKKLTMMILAGAMTVAQAFAAQEMTKEMKVKTNDKIAEKTRSILKEATSAMEDTRSALNNLDQNRPKEAQKFLESATGKLEMVVARQPSLGLAPFDINVITNDLVGDVNTANRLKQDTIRALQNDKLMEAKQMLFQLRSDLVINVANFPLATYPAALKEASRLIDQNKPNDAKALVADALSTIVLTQTIIPLPLARADYFINEASKLSEKKNRSSVENQRLTSYIRDGKDSLQLAEVLGYVPKNEFKDLYAKLDNASIQAKNGQTGRWFQEAKTKISNFFVRENSNQKQAQEAK